MRCTSELCMHPHSSIYLASLLSTQLSVANLTHSFAKSYIVTILFTMTTYKESCESHSAVMDNTSSQAIGFAPPELESYHHYDDPVNLEAWIERSFEEIFESRPCTTDDASQQNSLAPHSKTMPFSPYRQAAMIWGAKTLKEACRDSAHQSNIGTKMQKILFCGGHYFLDRNMVSNLLLFSSYCSGSHASRALIR